MDALSKLIYDGVAGPKPGEPTIVLWAREGGPWLAKSTPKLPAEVDAALDVLLLALNRHRVS